MRFQNLRISNSNVCISSGNLSKIPRQNGLKVIKVARIEIPSDKIFFFQAAILPPPSKNIEEGIETSATKDLEKDEVDIINPIENLDKYTQIQKEEWNSEDIESAFKAHENFRIDSDLIENVNEVLKKFIGSHYYHNYTSGK